MAFRTYELYLDVTYVAKPVVAVTAPSGTVSNTNRPVVSWSNTLDADGGTQDHWEVRVFSAAQYGAAGFDPATSSATTESGVVTSWETAYQVVKTLNDTVTYRAYVRIAQRVNGVRHWSNWAYSEFTISVALPAPSSLTLTPESSAGRIKVRVVPGTGGAATTDLHELEVSLDDGVTWAIMRHYGTTREIVGQANTYYHYEARNGAPTRYRVRAIHNYSGTYAYSAWTEETATWSADQWWLKDVLEPWRNLPVELFSYTGIQRPARQGVFQALGASRPLVVSDTRGGEAGTVVVQARTVAGQDALEEFVLAVSTVFLQGPVGHAEPDRFVVFGDMGTDRVVDKGLFPIKRSTLAWTQVDTPEGGMTVEQYVA